MLRTLAEHDSRYQTVVPDGVYSSQTMSAVAQFQQNHGLPVTGVTDERTWEEIVTRYEPALIFVDERLYGNLAVPIFRFGNDFRALLSHFDELFVVANSKRRTRAKIENRLGAVGLALGVFAKENVQALFKEEILALVVSKILQE